MERIYTILSRKLSGEATASELEELNNILKQYPDNQYAALILEAFWNTPVESDKDFLEATYHLHLNKLIENGYNLHSQEEISNAFFNIPEPDKKINYLQPLLLLAAASLIIGVLYFTLINKNKNEPVVTIIKNTDNEVTTKQGARTKILLPDGTSVWLNGNSKLLYNTQKYGEIIREVTLTGEGYFDVVKNANKPFIIHTVAMDIKVLGTAFNIKSYPAEKISEASLIRGSIEVTLTHKKNEIVTLKPNEKITVSNIIETVPANKDTIMATKKNVVPTIQTVIVAPLKLDKKENTFKEIAWTENKLMFKNERLESIALILTRWFGQEVIIKNDKLKDLQFTGNFHEENIIQVLQALQFSYNFNYKNENNLIIIY